MTVIAPKRESRIRPGLLIAAAGFIVAGVALVVLFATTSDPPTDAVPVEEDDGDDELFEFSGGHPLTQGGAGSPLPSPDVSPLSPSLRAQIVVAMRDGREATLTPEVLVATLQQNRSALRECVRAAGGWRAMRAALPDGAARTRPRMTFDVGGDGRLRPGSLALEPAGPVGLSACVSTALESLQFPSSGGEGVHVELPLALGRRGRRSLDGGVERGRGGRGERRRDSARPSVDGEGRAAGTATVPAVAPPAAAAAGEQRGSAP